MAARPGSTGASRAQTPGPGSRQHERRRPSTSGRNSAATNFVMKPSTKYRARRRAHGASRRFESPAAVQARKWIHARRSRQQERRFHVVAAEAVVEEQRRVYEEHQHRDGAADRTDEARRRSGRRRRTPAAEERIPEAQAELVVRQQAQLDGRRDDPELERRLFEKRHVVLVGLLFGSSQSPDLEDAVDGEGVDRLVVLEIAAAETEEEREAEEREDESQPEPAHPHSLMQVTSDQIRGMFTFSIETGCSSACARNAGRSRSDLKPMWTVNGEIARSSQAISAVRAAEVIEEDDAAAGTADAPHLARDRDRVGHDADQVRRVDDVEGTVGELEIGGVHLQQADVADALARDAIAGLLEHRARQIDPGDRAVARIQTRR